MRFFAKLAVIFCLILIGGFFVFAATLPRSDAHDALAKLDAAGPFSPDHVGIVALTGARGARIERAIALYGEGVADRVLISGTNPSVTKADLAVTADPDILDCCVDLGQQARTTVGNAIETRNWAREADYRAVLLVTDGFHLPRATLEVRHAAPELIVIGVPVGSDRVPTTEWFRSRDAWQMLAKEYVKFLWVRIRTMG